MAVEPQPRPVLDRDKYAPFAIHPLAPVDLDKQIPRKSDQRQMEPWQRIGTYAAGLALADAGIAGDADILSRADMIVAAGGGERDNEVDGAILGGIGAAPDPQAFLNERLTNDLRPTLFLAQLSNLLAGNISIVHKVTGSSRTFMGEEAAGVSAVEIAVRRIRSGQSDVCLVGGSFNADRYDVFVDGNIGGRLWRGEPGSVWARGTAGGGLCFGSVGAFLVLESEEHAKARARAPYARLGEVLSDRCRREPGQATANAQRQFERLRDGHKPVVLSGASGDRAATSEEQQFLAGLLADGAIEAVRAPLSLLGSCREPIFPLLVGLAALAVRHKGFYRPADETGFEQPFAGTPDAIIVTCWSLYRGEGMGIVEPVA
jgi:3-oxoacyl-[acyl-carrier-protein] synthase II